MDRPVLNEGKATYADAKEADQSLLASALFQVEGSVRFTFFRMSLRSRTISMTILKRFRKMCSVIQTRMPAHNPQQTQFDEKKLRRASLLSGSPTDRGNS